MEVKEAIEHCDEIIKKMDNCECRKEHEELKEFLEELQKYKDTGLTSEQIMELKERDTAKVPNKKLRHRGGFETCHCPNCDTSYQIDGRYTITDEYCPICGKLLDSAFESFCANCGQRISPERSKK